MNKKSAQRIRTGKREDAPSASTEAAPSVEAIEAKARLKKDLIAFAEHHSNRKKSAPA